jgi:hypothetical protein
MRVLYHGTRYMESILADRRLRCALVGDKHVSLTTRKSVAKYWAEMRRDDVIGFAHIVTLDRDLLESDGFPLVPFDSTMASFNEHEIACLKSIKPIWRYILKIERLPNSYAAREEIIRTKPGYRPVLRQNRRGIV